MLEYIKDFVDSFSGACQYFKYTMEQKRQVREYAHVNDSLPVFVPEPVTEYVDFHKFDIVKLGWEAKNHDGVEAANGQA